MDVTITIPDDQLDKLADRLVDRLLDRAPGLEFGGPLVDDDRPGRGPEVDVVLVPVDTSLEHPVDTSTSTTPLSAIDAEQAAAKTSADIAAAADAQLQAERLQDSDTADRGAPGTVVGVFDARSGRIVDAGDQTDGADDPAMAAPSGEEYVKG